MFGAFGDAVGAGFGLEDHRVVQERRGGGRLGEFGAEGSIAAECGPARNQRGAGEIPEGARTAVAQHDFISGRQREEVGQPFADRGDQMLHRILTMRGAQ
jgi:hypothetical protein